MTKVVLCRNGQVVQEVPFGGGRITWVDKFWSSPHVRHPERLESLDEVAEGFIEIFERDANAEPWPCCGAVVFNSTNWTKGPEWFLRMIGEERVKL